MLPGLATLVTIKKDTNEDSGGPAGTTGTAPVPLVTGEGWFPLAPDLTGHARIPWPRDSWGHTAEAELSP